jgi:hypothetical protein
VKLVPVHVPEGDAGFSPGCMAAFEQTLKETEEKGIRVRAVVRSTVMIFHMKTRDADVDAAAADPV